MKSSMYIQVKILAGTSLMDAVIEAKQKCRLLGLAYINFDFNGTEFSISQNTDVADILWKWDSGNHRNFIIG